MGSCAGLVGFVDVNCVWGRGGREVLAEEEVGREAGDAAAGDNDVHCFGVSIFLRVVVPGEMCNVGRVAEIFNQLVKRTEVIAMATDA